MANERVLIVEDEKIIALDLQRRLEHFGYTIVDTCAEGPDAIEKTKSHEPDIVLMDIMLNGPIDGIEAAKIIKQECNIPVVFLTAYVDDRTLERAKTAEPFGYILKPFKERELYTAIDIALYKYHADQNLKRQERLFSAILHSVNDGIIAIDNDLMTLFINPVASKMSGWSEEDAKGKSIHHILSLIDSKNLMPIIPALLPADESSKMFRDCILKGRLGQSFIIDGSITKIHQTGNTVAGYVIAFRDVTELKTLSAKIDYQTSHDTLTGLGNRESFSLQLQTLLEDLQRFGGSHTLLQMDVDRFKIVNDTCGTQAGDELLRQIATYIQTLTQRDDYAARLGGDEFAIILKDCMIDNAIQVAQRLQDAIQNHKFVWQNNLFPITLSIGLVPLSSEDKDMHMVLAAADDACYIAKEEGGNRIRIFQRNEEKYVLRRGQMEWVSRINHALEHNRFRLWYQLIEPLKNLPGLHAKLEILIRMENQDGTIISPGAFIPSAERYGLMAGIDRWVFENTMKAWVRMKEKNHELISRIFTINLSGPTLLDDSFIDYAIKIVHFYGASPSSFCFEITETSAIQNLSHASRFIERLKSFGFTFSLDDFGAGFSSFNYLKNLPVDYLKIDGSIVQNIDESLINFTMVESINSMGQVIGVKTIAEFARNPSVIERLRRIGVDYAQGYAIAEPKPLPYEG
ncbi:MAG: EAL domain-containing protein [Termitinemataceae bacterium]